MNHPSEAQSYPSGPSGPALARDKATAAARILVVEDKEDLAGLLLFKLRAAGHIAEHASTGAGALVRAKEFRPDLILLDSMLPDITGTDVLRAIQGDSDLAHTSAIIVTARGEEADGAAGGDAGAVHYVAKPFGVQELMLRVVEVLNALARNDWTDPVQWPYVRAPDGTGATPDPLDEVRNTGAIDDQNLALLDDIWRSIDPD